MMNLIIYKTLKVLINNEEFLITYNTEVMHNSLYSFSHKLLMQWEANYQLMTN